jgi:hypothetical protein
VSILSPVSARSLSSSPRVLRLVKRNGVSETNLHNHCNQHGQLLQIQLHSSVARQSRRLSIRPSVEHAPTEIGQTKWRQRDKSAQPLQSTRSVVTNPIAFQRRTAIQAIVDSSRASNTRQLRLVKRNGVSETNLHDHCNHHGQLLQIQLHSSVARQSKRLSIRRSVEHAPTEIGQTKWRQRDKSAQPLQSTRSVVTNPIAFQRRTAIQAIVDSSERRTRAN